MTKNEIEQKRKKILKNPAAYFVNHEIVEEAYKDNVIDKLTADALHARLDGTSYGKYKGKAYIANGRPTVNHINTADVRTFRKHNYAGRRKSKRLTDSDREEIRRLYVDEGKSANEIGVLLEITGGTVTRNLRKMGVPILKHPKRE